MRVHSETARHGSLPCCCSSSGGGAKKYPRRSRSFVSQMLLLRLPMAIMAMMMMMLTTANGWPFEEDKGRYFPDWSSLDTRVPPTWFDEAKIGVFLHWGVFSVPAYGSEWFWWRWQGSKSKDVVDFMKQNYPPTWTYADFAREFRAEFYNASRWADLFRRAGAKYLVLTSKHHEGYTLWPSATAFSWNSQDVGPQRDLVGELADAVRATGELRFGVYHSLFEWFNPLYLADKGANFQTQDFVRAKTLPELYDLVKTYKPEIIWSDGEWEAPSKYWNATHFLAWLYNDSPVKDTILVNDRWGKETRGKHGDYSNYDDNFNPGHLMPRKWESATTLDKNSWGYRRDLNVEDVLSLQELLTILARTISCNGNLLINVGPRSDGTIDPIFEERLLQLGRWLELNGEAIYGSHAWTSAQNDTLNPDVWYTYKKSKGVYAIVLKSPPSNELVLGSLNCSNVGPKTAITRLDDGTRLKFFCDDKILVVKVPYSRAMSELPTEAFVIKVA